MGVEHTVVGAEVGGFVGGIGIDIGTQAHRPVVIFIPVGTVATANVAGSSLLFSAEDSFTETLTIIKLVG